MDIQIIYEDNHLIAAIKPAGVLSQADGSDSSDMLTILKSYLKDKYNKQGNVYLGLLMRLDKPVSGIMVFAKTSKAASRMSDKIRQHAIIKEYSLLVWGILANPSGTLHNYLLKDKERNFTTVYDYCIEGSKEAILDYEVVSTGSYMGEDISLIKVRLHTGRSHQIRTQFKHIGHPIVGDMKYGTHKHKVDICLFCNSITVDHPVTKEKLELNAPLPTYEPWNSI